LFLYALQIQAKRGSNRKCVLLAVSISGNYRFVVVVVVVVVVVGAAAAADAVKLTDKFMVRLAFAI